jgi:hypothetical protein
MKLLVALASVAVMIGTATPVYADPGDVGYDVGSTENDKDFLLDLRQAGLSYGDPEQAVQAARSVCALADGGKDDAEIIAELRNRNPSFQGTGAAKFTTLAAAHYCPQYLTGEGRIPEPAGSP